MLRLGIVGLDTSHAHAFTQILSDPSYQYYLPGAQVIGAYQGGSSCFSLSMKRTDQITRLLVNEFNLEVFDDIFSLASQVDAILLLSGDGRQHLDQFYECALGKPVFIDKPLSCSLAEAREIMSLAESTHTPVMSASSLRFAQGMEPHGFNASDIFSCEIFGPMPELDDYPGLFWYGIHSVEMAYQLNGEGCLSVSCWHDITGPLLSAEWKTGVNVFIRGFYSTHATQFGWIFHSKTNTYFGIIKSDPPYYYYLLQRVLEFFRTGVPAVNLRESLETIAFIEAAHRSRINRRRERLELN